MTLEFIQPLLKEAPRKIILLVCDGLGGIHLEWGGRTAPGIEFDLTAGDVAARGNFCPRFPAVDLKPLALADGFRLEKFGV